jgi:hypothetical protein
VLARYLLERKRANPDTTVLVHSGDMIGASPPESGLLQDEPTIRVLNQIGFDVGTPGNHEFDEGLEELLACSTAARPSSRLAARSRARTSRSSRPTSSTPTPGSRSSSPT